MSWYGRKVCWYSQTFYRWVMTNASFESGPNLINSNVSNSSKQQCLTRYLKSLSEGTVQWIQYVENFWNRYRIESVRMNEWNFETFPLRIGSLLSHTSLCQKTRSVFESFLEFQNVFLYVNTLYSPVTPLIQVLHKTSKIQNALKIRNLNFLGKIIFMFMLKKLVSSREDFGV